MKNTLDKLVHTIFGKSSISECSIEEIRLVAEKFPFFATAHLLLVEKMKEDGAPGFKDQLQRASLYFNNNLWLNYIINENDQTRDEDFKQETLSLEKTIPFEDSHNDEQVIANLKYKPPVMQAQLEEGMEKPVTPLDESQVPEDATPGFEPYYTVDYFASQGIKPSVEEKPADRFGQQLKSFTEWLKTLKKLPVQEFEKTVDTVSEQSVIHMAEHSIENREVVTEAMAEVWIKQGENEKAIELFNKLSLLNPGKSSYFAGRIENLKKH